ncbi:SDR family oxidoreductase [Pseudomonas sp. EA_35y_Pfl2_R5]|uniref:SDR family oxidoreductase n=1 Tax=Pseudomonas sp. EA_35y_Pfl2_R5 TaxID=3088690 RepID=UPI0030D8A581
MAVSRSILITGASRGIGLGLTQAFVQTGWQVHAVSRNLTGSNELQALATQHGQSLQLIECDLEQREAGQLIDQALGDQHLTCALFNAGVYGPQHQDPRQASSAEIGQLFLANAIAPISLAQQLAGRIETGGVIAFISSQMASLQLNHALDMPLYGASKAALNSLLLSWSSHYAELPWSLLALHPGWVRTAMGGPDAQLSVLDSAAGLYQVISAQLDRRTCAFLDYQGQTLPW